MAKQPTILSDHEIGSTALAALISRSLSPCPQSEMFPPEVIVIYDLRFGWDFRVRRSRPGEIEVTVSVPLDDARFGVMLRELLQAIEDVRDGGRSMAYRGVGPFGRR